MPTGPGRTGNSICSAGNVPSRTFADLPGHTAPPPARSTSLAVQAPGPPRPMPRRLAKPLTRRAASRQIDLPCPGTRRASPGLLDKPGRVAPSLPFTDTPACTTPLHFRPTSSAFFRVSPCRYRLPMTRQAWPRHSSPTCPAFATPLPPTPDRHASPALAAPGLFSPVRHAAPGHAAPGRAQPPQPDKSLRPTSSLIKPSRRPCPHPLPPRLAPPTGPVIPRLFGSWSCQARPTSLAMPRRAYPTRLAAPARLATAFPGGNRPC